MDAQSRVDGCRTPDLVHQLNGRPGILNPKSAPGYRLLINRRVEITEPATEFDLVAIDRDRSVSRLAVATTAGQILFVH
jgi:hypothetical protein